MTDKSHYFASHACAWATAPTRDEAHERLLLGMTDPTWVRNCLKSGEPLVLYSCKVHADATAPYRIEWFQPVDVETSDGNNHLVTYLTKTKFALMRDPRDEIQVLKAQLEETK